MNLDNGDIIWNSTSPFYGVDFSWSSDSRYVGMYFVSRIEGSSVVFDIMERKLILLPDLTEVYSHFGEIAKPREFRPDPDFKFIGWENPDTAIVDFKWITNDSGEFTGRYTFNVHFKKVTYK